MDYMSQEWMEKIEGMVDRAEQDREQNITLNKLCNQYREYNVNLQNSLKEEKDKNDKNKKEKEKAEDLLQYEKKKAATQLQEKKKAETQLQEEKNKVTDIDQEKEKVQASLKKEMEKFGSFKQETENNKTTMMIVIAVLSVIVLGLLAFIFRTWYCFNDTQLQEGTSNTNTEVFANDCTSVITISRNYTISRESDSILDVKAELRRKSSTDQFASKTLESTIDQKIEKNCTVEDPLINKITY